MQLEKFYNQPKPPSPTPLPSIPPRLRVRPTLQRSSSAGSTSSTSNNDKCAKRSFIKFQAAA